MFTSESIADSMTMYYEGVPMASIAKAMKCNLNTLKSRIWKERDSRGLNKRKKVHKKLNSEVLEFITDKEMVMDLYKSGVLPVDIADKWGTTTATVLKYLNEWGFITKQKITNTISLSELYKEWAHTVKGEEMILTVNKRPMFKLVRIL